MAPAGIKVRDHRTSNGADGETQSLQRSGEENEPPRLRPEKRQKRAERHEQETRGHHGTAAETRDQAAERQRNDQADHGIDRDEAGRKAQIVIV